MNFPCIDVDDVMVVQGDVYGYKHALAISQYDVEDTPMRDRERVSANIPDVKTDSFVLYDIIVGILLWVV